MSWVKTKKRMRKAGYAITRRSEVARLVLEATSSDPWGPHSAQMQEIARLSENPENCRKISKHMWARIGDKETRRIQKGLILLEYLLANGSERFRADTKMMSSQLQMLSRFHKHETGEQAALEAVIRKKAENILQMLSDDEFFQMEREKANKLKSTLSSVSYTDPQQSSYGYSDRPDPYGLRSGNDESPRQAQGSTAQQDQADYSYYSDDEPQPMAGGQAKNPYSPTGSGQNPFGTQSQQPNPFASQPQQQNPFGTQPQQQNPFASQPQQQNPFGTQPQQQNPFGTQQQSDPFASQQQRQQGGFDPFGGQTQKPPSAQQQFDVFNQAPQQQQQTAWQQPQAQPQPQNQQMFWQQQSGPAQPQQQTFWQQQPATDPFGSPAPQQQPQTFWQQQQAVSSPFQAQAQPQQPQGSPFQQQQMQQQQGFWQQQPAAAPQPQPLSADDLLFGSSPAPPKAPQPAPQVSTGDAGPVFLDLSSGTPAAQRRPQGRVLQDDFGDLVDLDLRHGSVKRDYGRPDQQRGHGPTLGSGQGF